MNKEKKTRIAVDIGWTFVDAIKLDTQTGQFELKKSSTTPSEPWIGVLKAIDDDRLQVEAYKFAQEIAKKPSNTLRYTKRLLKMGSKLPLSEFLDFCALFQGISHNHIEPLHLTSRVIISQFNKIAEIIK